MQTFTASPPASNSARGPRGARCSAVAAPGAAASWRLAGRRRELGRFKKGRPKCPWLGFLGGARRSGTPTAGRPLRSARLHPAGPKGSSRWGCCKAVAAGGSCCGTAARAAPSTAAHQPQRSLHLQMQAAPKNLAGSSWGSAPRPTSPSAARQREAAAAAAGWSPRLQRCSCRQALQRMQSSTLAHQRPGHPTPRPPGSAAGRLGGGAARGSTRLGRTPARRRPPSQAPRRAPPRRKKSVTSNV